MQIKLIGPGLGNVTMIFKRLIFKLGLQIDILKQFYETVLMWMSQNTTDGMTTLD